MEMFIDHAATTGGLSFKAKAQVYQNGKGISLKFKGKEKSVEIKTDGMIDFFGPSTDGKAIACFLEDGRLQCFSTKSGKPVSASRRKFYV